MSRSPTGHRFWMPARITGDTWPGEDLTQSGNVWSWCAAPTALQNVLLGRRDIFMVPTRCADAGGPLRGAASPPRRDAD